MPMRRLSREIVYFVFMCVSRGHFFLFPHGFGVYFAREINFCVYIVIVFAYALLEGSVSVVKEAGFGFRCALQFFPYSWLCVSLKVQHFGCILNYIPCSESFYVVYCRRKFYRSSFLISGDDGRYESSRLAQLT